jgi:tetratricopeptide (TPR) repeat protein/S1-C subfamily serine protease
MYRSSLFLTAAFVGTTVALIQPVAAAKSASEIQSIARAVTVEIKRQKQQDNGSGIIIQKQGDLYTLVTNRHVICGKSDCSKIPANEVFTLNFSDGSKYKVPNSSIKLLGSSDNIVDLAIIQFRSNRNYAVAKVAAPGSLKVEDVVYTSGFPCDRDSEPCQPLGYLFGKGNAIAVVNKRLTGDGGGYTIVYNAETLPGMSGGGIFNNSGELVAIHGYGDQFKENTKLDDKSRVGSKIGYNRGIPVRWLVQNLAELGIYIGTERPAFGIRAARSQAPTTADEYFIAGFDKYVEPGNNVKAGKKQAIQKFSRAIQLNPKYKSAYFGRAIAYEQIQEFRQSLSDYNQSISLDPKDYNAYNNRALLKANNLNDIQGALADYNQSISINPKNSNAYYNRALLKANNLNDIQGALADYNQSISINPKNFQAHTNRAVLKADKLNDIQGALADYNQAISINPKNFQAYTNRAILKQTKLNDIQGALTDYNQVISINPKNYEAYVGRATLKQTKLNDTQGALADCNQAISINPKKSNAYVVRGMLKYINNDKPGGIADVRQAAKLARAQGDSKVLQVALEVLKSWGVSE